jgi:hypothetical protein
VKRIALVDKLLLVTERKNVEVALVIEELHVALHDRRLRVHRVAPLL